MSPSASTALSQAQELVGFTSTDRETVDALLRSHRRAAGLNRTVTVGSQHLAAFPHAETLLASCHSTEADLVALRWHHRNLVFHSPTFVLKTTPIRMTPLPFLTEYVLDRLRLLPIRWNLAGALVSGTAETQGQATTDILSSSTDPLSMSSGFVRRRAADLFAAAVEETFEDGIESSFSEGLATLLKTYGVSALAAVEALVLSPETNAEVAVEAVKLVGAVDDPASKLYRRGLLEKLLDLPSTRIRHAAASGLAAMDDPASLPALTTAMEREGNRRLRQYLELVVDQLEHTRSCLSS